MAFAAYNFHIQDPAGNDVGGASLEVRRESDGGLATLYGNRDGTVALGNPFTSLTATGRFYVVGGCYKITVTSAVPGASVIWRHVAIGTMAEHDVEEFITVGSVRELLLVDRDYFVDASRPDNNGDGRTLATAFKTIQKGVNVISGSLDVGARTVRILVSAGTYNETITLKDVVGFGAAGTVAIIGDVGNPASRIIDGGGNTCITANGISGIWAVRGVKLQSTGASSLMTASNATLAFGSIDFGQAGLAGGDTHILSQNNATVIGDNGDNYTISGSAFFHTLAQQMAQILTINMQTYFIGPRAFTVFARVTQESFLRADGQTFGTPVLWNAATDEITFYADEAHTVLKAHGLAVNDPIQFRYSAGSPVLTDINYFVNTVPDVNRITIKDGGGTPINITSTAAASARALSIANTIRYLNDDVTSLISTNGGGGNHFPGTVAGSPPPGALVGTPRNYT